MYIVFTILIQLDKKVQDVMCGVISPIIVDGKIVEKEFAKQQYTIPDIMSQLRQKDVFKIQDVKYAIVETNGELSVMKMNDKVNSMPLNIIEEGQISEANIKILNLSKEDVEKIARENNVIVTDVLVGTLDENSKFIYQLKDGVKS